MINAKFNLNEEEIMTDFQFKAIMAMVSEMLGKCKTLEDIRETKEAVDRLAAGETVIKHKEKENN